MTVEMVALTVLVIVFVAVLDGVRTARRPSPKSLVAEPKVKLLAGDPGRLGTQTVWR